MKPAWDKLITEYADSKTALVADVDCTAAGKDLCETHGVEGFPTIKWGEPSNLQDYDGGRDLKALKKFAKDNLKPVCGPANVDLCDEVSKKTIGEYMAMNIAELDHLISEKEKTKKDAEENFTAEVDLLQKRYEQLEKDKKETLDEIKASGLGWMKAVRATRSAKEEL